MNKKICKLVILMMILLGVCGIGTGVYAAEGNTLVEPRTAVAQDATATDTTLVAPADVNQTSTVAPAAPVTTDNNTGIGMVAAALATGLACIGAGIAVAVVASSAVGAISENPGLFGKTVIFAGLAEGIAIYGLIISIMILSKF